MNNNLPKRKNLRLYGYDYSKSGTYFVTICVENKQPILSQIQNDDINANTIILSKFGKIVAQEIINIESRHSDEKILDYVVMPNHIHLIIEANNSQNSLGKIIGEFKSIATLKCKKSGYSGEKLFQRNYYEHIIRDEDDYLTKAQYIKNNPEKWTNDKYYSV